MKYKGLYDDAILFPDYINTIDDFISSSRHCLAVASSEGRVKKAQTNYTNWNSLHVKRSKSTHFNVRTEKEHDLTVTNYSSEIDLWIAVLVRAIKDLDARGVSKERKERLRDQAIEYLNCKDYEVGSYLYVCEAIGLDANKLKARLEI